MTFLIIKFLIDLAPVVIGPSPPLNSNDTYTGSPSTNYTSTTGLKPNKTEIITVSVTGGTGPSTNDTDIYKVMQVSVTHRNVDVTFIRRALLISFQNRSTGECKLWNSPRVYVLR